MATAMKGAPAERVVRTYFNRPNSGARLAMASQLLDAFAKNAEKPEVTMGKLAEAAASHGDKRLEGFAAKFEAAHATNHSGRGEWHSAAVAMTGFLSDFKAHLSDERRNQITTSDGHVLLLTWRGKIHPDSEVWLYPGHAHRSVRQGRPQAAGPRPPLKGFEVITGKARREELNVGLCHAAISPGSTLHIVASRIGDWNGGDFFEGRDSYIKWAKSADSLLFDSPQPQGLTTRGTLKSKSEPAFSTTTKVGEIFNGWVWGVSNASLHQRYERSKLLHLEVARVHYRDFRLVFADVDFQGAKFSEWLESKSRNRDAYLPPAAVLQISLLPVLQIRESDEPLLVLAHRYDRARLSGSALQLWSAGVTGLAVSERLFDDDRGPGLEVQAQRLMRRQLALDVADSQIVWTGFSFRRERCAAVAHGVVKLTITPGALFDLFARRTIRHDSTQLTVISESSALRFLRSAHQETARHLFKEGDPHGEGKTNANLAASLGLWLVSRGKYRAGDLG
jgi:hypothetical protein